MSTQNRARHRGHRRLVAGAVVTVVAVVGAFAGVAAANSSAPVGGASAGTAPTTVRVAQTQLRDTRAVLRAERAGGLMATVRLTVFARVGGSWRSLGTERVGRPRSWFFNVLRGRAAVCRFAVANSPNRRFGVRLLVTPSIGCDGETRHFHVEGGDLVPG
jgi:hypothetical protein